MRLEHAQMVYAASRQQWREWLQKNHLTSKGVWLVFYKRGSGKPRVPYEAAVEEAICFGWIDSILKRIDDRKYIQRFTPRNVNSRWSELNVGRAEKMIREGLMTEVGLKKYRAAMAAGLVAPARPREFLVPPGLLAGLELNLTARDFFDRLPATQRKWYCLWINDGKRAETREKRIREAIQLLAQGKTLAEKWFSRA